MEASQILKADVLDLLFENRNKNYGAYFLRKTYKKRLWTAVLITVIFGISAVWFLQPADAETKNDMVEVRSVVLEHIEEAKPIPPPPPVKEVAPAPQKAKTVAAAKLKKLQSRKSKEQSLHPRLSNRIET
jgi:protein TonB